MADCPYCAQSFEDESAIRKHLYEDHDYDELGRIDSKRVDQYVDEHDLEPDDEPVSGDGQIGDEQIHTGSGGSSRGDMWELRDVRALSTTEIVDTLAEFGIETTEESFRDRATAVNAATVLSEQWEDEYDVTVTGHDRDFVWMAAEVLWERWTPDIPNRERIYDLYHEGRDLFEGGNDTDGCQRWLTAWEFVAAVTPDDITSVGEADDYLPVFLSLDQFLRALSEHLESVAETKPSYHERRIEFCREVCERFPDTDGELLLDLRHALADSLDALGRDDEIADELDALIEAYPDDPWAYFKKAERLRHQPPEATTTDDLERAIELYRQALDRNIEQRPTVEDRLEEVEQRLADVNS